LTPGRPGAWPTGGADRESGVKVDAMEMRATRIEIARGSRRGAMLTDAGVHDARLVQHVAGLAHAFETPVGRVVVRTGHHVESDRPEIFGHRRCADDPDAAELGLRHGRRAREIDGGPLEVAERRVGVMDDLADRREPRRLRHRPGDDAIADRGDGKAVHHAHRQLALWIARRRRRRLLRDDRHAGEHEDGSDQWRASHGASLAEKQWPQEQRTRD